jgi:hypothetical protein
VPVPVVVVVVVLVLVVAQLAGADRLRGMAMRAVMVMFVRPRPVAMSERPVHTLQGRAGVWAPSAQWRTEPAMSTVPIAMYTSGTSHRPPRSRSATT